MEGADTEEKQSTSGQVSKARTVFLRDQLRGVRERRVKVTAKFWVCTCMRVPLPSVETRKTHVGLMTEWRPESRVCWDA